MARRLGAFIVLLAIVGLPTGAIARAAGGVTILPIGTSEQQSPVEQMSDWPWLPSITDCSANVRCVVNPTNCSWDVDDHWQKWVSGVALPGSSASSTSCLLISQNPTFVSIHGSEGFYSWTRTRAYTELSAAATGLVVTIAFGDRTFTATPVASGNRYRYDLCVGANYDPADPHLVPIAGSNASTVAGSTDAVAARTSVVITVANPTGKRIRDITGFIGMTGTDPSNCHLQGQVEYPYAW